MKISYLVLFLLVTSKLYSQKLEINGNVVDSNTKNPVILASVKILAVKDSTVLINTIADKNGSFNVKLISRDKEFVIKTSAIGYAEKYMRLFLYSAGESARLTIALQPQTRNLKEVVVKSYKSNFTMEVDKITYNVSNDSTLLNKSAKEALAKMPFFFPNGINGLQYKDGQKFIVLLNGQKYGSFNSNLSIALSAIPTKYIKRIELINDPSAKYKNQGYEAVVNVVTEGYLKGSIGSLSLTNIFVQKNYNQNNSGFFYYQNNKFGVQFNLINGRDGSNAETKNTSKFIAQNDTLYQNGDISSKNVTNRLAGDMSLNYSFNDFLGMTFYGSTGHNSLKRDVFSVHDDFLGNLNLDNYNSVSKYNQNQSVFEVGGDIIKKFHQPSKELSFSIRFNSATPHDEDMVNNSSLNKNIYLRTLNESNNNDFSTELFYSSLLSKLVTCESSISYTERKFSNTFYFDSLENSTNNWIKGSIKDDAGNYGQKIIRFYQGLKYRKNNFSINAGINFDKSIYQSFTLSTNTKFEEAIYNFYPTIQVRLKGKKNNTYYLKYNKVIRRPSAQLVGNFVDISDPQTLRIGNNKLSQDVIHNLILGTEGFSKNKKLSFYGEIGLSYVPTIMRPYIYFDTLLKKSISEYRNIGNLIMYSFKTGFNLNLSSKFRLGIINIIRFSKQNNTITNTSYQGWSDQLNTNCNVNLWKHYTIQAIANLYSNASTFQGSQSNLPSYIVSISRPILKKRGSLAIYSENFITTQEKQVSTIAEQNFYRQTETISPSRKLYVIFSYRFGNLKVGEPKKQKRLSSSDLKSE